MMDPVYNLQTLQISISDKDAPVGGLDECCDISPSINFPLDGPNLQFGGYILERILVSQDSVGFLASSVWSPGLTEH